MKSSLPLLSFSACACIHDAATNHFLSPPTYGLRPSITPKHLDFSIITVNQVLNSQIAPTAAANGMISSSQNTASAAANEAILTFRNIIPPFPSNILNMYKSFHFVRYCCSSKAPSVSSLLFTVSVSIEQPYHHTRIRFSI